MRKRIDSVKSETHKIFLYASAYTVGMANLRDNLEKEMAKRGLSALALAERAGVSQPTISRFLKGDSDEPRGIMARKIALALGVREAVRRLA